MANKLKALVIGAYPRFAQKIKKKLEPILDYRLVLTTEKVKPDYVNGVGVVIVLSDYVGKMNASEGRDMARARGVPFIECVSENYVRTRLTEMNLIGKEQEAVEKENAKAEPEAPQQETQVGLTHEQILQYVPRATKEVEELVSPGERIDESIFIPILAEAVGLPVADLKEFIIPELIVSGLISNTVGTTWRRMTGPGIDYRYEKDNIEAPKPRALVRNTMFRSLQGLGAGPFRSKYAIAKEMEKYKEFTKQDGTVPTTSYLQNIVRQAQEIGIVEDKDGGFYIKCEEEVTLTPLETKKEEPPPKEKEKEKPKPEPVAEVKVGTTTVPTTFVSLASLKPDPVSTPAPVMKDGTVRPIGQISTVDVPLQLPMLKKMMPEKYWDETAYRSLAGRLSAIGLGGRSLTKDAFTVQEWDALAWETLKKLPLANVVPVWPPETYQDERLACLDCGEFFIFTKSKQEDYFRRFGQVSRPKNCYKCWRSQKNGEASGDDFGERILGRTGGQ